MTKHISPNTRFVASYWGTSICLMSTIHWGSPEKNGIVKGKMVALAHYWQSGLQIVLLDKSPT
jgi:hypothetical protein